MRVFVQELRLRESHFKGLQITPKGGSPIHTVEVRMRNLVLFSQSFEKPTTEPFDIDLFAEPGLPTEFINFPTITTVIVVVGGHRRPHILPVTSKGRPSSQLRSYNMDFDNHWTIFPMKTGNALTIYPSGVSSMLPFWGVFMSIGRPYVLHTPRVTGFITDDGYFYKSDDGKYCFTVHNRHILTNKDFPVLTMCRFARIYNLHRLLKKHWQRILRWLYRPEGKLAASIVDRAFSLAGSCT